MYLDVVVARAAARSEKEKKLYSKKDQKREDLTQKILVMTASPFTLHPLDFCLLPSSPASETMVLLTFTSPVAEPFMQDVASIYANVPVTYKHTFNGFNNPNVSINTLPPHSVRAPVHTARLPVLAEDPAKTEEEIKERTHVSNFFFAFTYVIDYMFPVLPDMWGHWSPHGLLFLHECSLCGGMPAKSAPRLRSCRSYCTKCPLLVPFLLC